MKIVIAPDSFKESLTALEVAQAIEEGFKTVYVNAEYIHIPMADGGEGTVQSLVDALHGKLIETKVMSPQGIQVSAAFGLSGDKKTAIIEMAAASGLHLVPPEQRNPLYTTTYGTGELIKSALDLGITKCILGIGGSATNDGGAGMLQALGAKLLDQHQQPISFGGAALSKLTTIDLSQLDSRLQQCEFEIACDVTNPLYGQNGASVIFAPQKGATPAQVQQLDQALMHFAQIVQQQLNIDIAHKAGTGASGGLGAGLLLLPHSRLRSGVQIVIDNVNLAQYIKQADLVITGEGCMDAQSIRGKTPIGVAKIAKQFNKPVIAIVGCLREDYEVVYQQGIDAVFPIIRQLDTQHNILQQGRKNLISTAKNVAKLYQLAH